MPDSYIQAKQMAISRTVLICIALAAATFVAFEGVRSNDFVHYDDDKYITSNEYVQKGLSLESIKWAFTTWHQGNWHPLTWMSHLIDSTVFGMKPAGHHLVSVGFHIANVILLFLILKKMTGAIWPSAFVAAVFGLHPLGVESVAWVAERKNVLSNLFAFLTIWAYLWYSQKPGWRRYAVIAILFAAGLLSKSMLVTLPFVLILLDYWPMGRFGGLKGWRWLWRAIVDKVPLLAMSAAFCVVTYLAQVNAGAATNMVSMPLGLRAENVMVSYIRYIGKLFYPTSLAVLYPLDANGYPLWETWGCLLLLLAVTTVVILERRKHRFLLTGWLWYLGTLVPVIGLVQVGVQAMADRYMYLPGIGIYIIVAWLASEAVAKLRLPKIVPAITGVVILVALLLITRTQVEYWKNSESLFRHSLDVTTNNYVMYSNYGQVLKSKGRLDEAIDNFRRALELNPGWVEVHDKLACALQDKGLDAEAVAEFELVLRIKPDKTDTRNSYGVALVKIKQYDKAIEQFTRVLTEDPCRVSALNNLYKAGVEGGKLDKVLDVILGLQAKDPNNFEFCQKVGLIYGIQGNIDAAIVQLEKACRLSNYQVAEPMAFLSQAYASKKDIKRAAEMAQKALGSAQKEGRDDIVAQLKTSLESYQRVMKGN
ncbi:MAG: tetratricopeptide repeat protein [Sedimentisphaerales bacterium]|jgi:tetratricopeptide (TPR) repeat protein